MFVTVATKNGVRRPMLMESARHWRLPLRILQEDEPWVGYVHNKIRRLRELLLPMVWEEVVYADCADVFMLHPRILPTLPPCGWLYAGETNCFPWPERHKPMYTCADRFPYPNSGVWAATREAFERNTASMLALDDPYEENGRSVAQGNCDQLLSHFAVLSGQAEVDTLGDWCLNLYGLADLEVDARLKVQQPAFVHGSSYENKGRVWALKQKLGL